METSVLSLQKRNGFRAMHEIFPGHFLHVALTALNNVISLLHATVPGQLNLHLITSVARCFLLQAHLVDATLLWIQSPSLKTVWMTCVFLMGMKNCFAGVWANTLLRAKGQDLKSNHGGVRSAVSIINLDCTHVVSLVWWCASKSQVCTHAFVVLVELWQAPYYEVGRLM